MEEVKLKISDPSKHINKPFEVKKNFSEAEKTKLAKSAKGFESLLTSMMLKSMTKSMGGLFGENSYGGDMFDTIFEQEISSYMTETKSLGVANMIYKKITGEDLVGKLDRVNINPKSFSSYIESRKTYKPQIDKDIVAIRPGIKSINRLQKYEPIINAASQKFGVNKNIIKSIILTESAANPNAVSSAKAKGLMQLMDTTATDMGVNNSFDPKDNIFGGTKYFAQMFRQYKGNTKLALAAYNAGPGNVEKYNGVPPFEETKNYISRVLGYLNHLEE